MKKVISYTAVFVAGFVICALVLNGLYGRPRQAPGEPYKQSVRPSPPIATVGNDTIANAARKVFPSVVNIDTRSRPRMRVGFPFDIPDLLGIPFGAPAPPVQAGKASGVIIHSDGYILTNNHVVENVQQIVVTLADGKTKLAGKVIGTDPRTDLAVIKVNRKNLPSARVGNSDNLTIGDWVVAIGNALGLEGGATVTAGVISANRRSFAIGNKVFENLLQTDAAINRGNSGGALADIHGDLVGINTAIASTSPDAGSIGIGFAIPIEHAMKIANELISKGRVVRPWIGIGYGPITDDVRQAFTAQGVTLPKKGVLIHQVVPGSPADKAGVRRWDVLQEMDRKAVTAPDFVRQQVGKHKVGDKVMLMLARGDDTKLVVVTLGEMPHNVE